MSEKNHRIHIRMTQKLNDNSRQKSKAACMTRHKAYCEITSTQYAVLSRVVQDFKFLLSREPHRAQAGAYAVGYSAFKRAVVFGHGALDYSGSEAVTK